MGRPVLLVFVCLVLASRAQDTHHEALLEYFEQEQREELGSGWGTDLEEEEDEAPPTRIVRCLRCSKTEEDPDVCRPESLRRDMHEFIVACTGLCLNITSVNKTAGNVLEYDCANDRHGRKDKCLTLSGTRICVCGSDLCNGPEEVFAENAEEEFYEIYTQPPHHSKEIVPQSSHGNSCSSSFLSVNILTFPLFIAIGRAHSIFHIASLI